MELPNEQPDAFFFATPVSMHGHFINFRTRSCLRIFRKLKDDSSTGPGDLSNRILKFVGPYIAAPFCSIVHALIRDGHWPDVWRIHRLIQLFNGVFQRTVLGTTLWNVFVADVAFSAASQGGESKLFADDLNVFQNFHRRLPNEEVATHMTAIQKEIHA